MSLSSVTAVSSLMSSPVTNTFGLSSTAAAAATTTTTTPGGSFINALASLSSCSGSSSSATKSRFPRLQECAHFHYEVNTVDIPKNFKVLMCYENESSSSSSPSGSSAANDSVNTKPNPNNSKENHHQLFSGANSLTASMISTTSTSSTTATATANSNLESSIWFHLQVTSNDKKWIIYRTYENFRYLDKHLHDCIFDRKFSCLEQPSPLNSFSSSTTLAHCSNETNQTPTASSSSSSKKPLLNQTKSSELVKQLRLNLANYLARFCEIAFINPINCGPILNWFEIDNRGNRLFAIDDSPINIPGVGAAVVKKRYVAQGLDEISLDVGNMISVIDMPPPDESVWWRGKKELEVGFFPSECVELIKSNQHLSSNVTEHLPKLSQNQSVRLKHGKLITLLRSFFNTRPARNQLQSKGILKQRVFACDLGEHLSNSQQEVPKILSICTEFIEKHGTVDGIYRHTGLQSNIQRLRNAFDEEKFNEIEQEAYINDVHAVSSLLKMYFRELPNPLLTFQLYHKFIKAVDVEDKIVEIHDVVQQLPPPHYRTLAFLMQHLHKLSNFSSETNMNTKNLAIVWAPNLLRSKEMDSNCMQLDMLHSITLQANISEFLIANADTIFNDKFASLVRKSEIKTNIAKTYRPISVCYTTGGPKLLSLEEAQDKYKQVGPAELPKYHTVIEIPDLQKKKQKEKKSSSSNQTGTATTAATNNGASNFSSSNQPPANIQIQQQFDNLQLQQQQQQQLQQQSQLTGSISYQSMSNASTPTQVSTNTNTPPAESSSPAFKYLLRNLRGSLKHQSSSSSNSNNNNNNNNSSSSGSNANANNNNETNSMSSTVAKNLNLNQFPVSSNSETTESMRSFNSTNMISPIQTNIKPNHQTFKPTNLTPVAACTSTPASAPPSTTETDLKHDYSSCISQLQSAAAQAISSQLTTQTSMNNSNNGNLSPTVNLNIGAVSNTNDSIQSSSFTSNQTSSVLFRNKKFNQSMNSSHSNGNIQMSNQQQTLNNLLVKLNDSPSSSGGGGGGSNNHQQQSHQSNVLSTFKDLGNPSSSNNNSDSKKSTENPIPSKRRTIQIQSQIGPNSTNSSFITSEFKPQAPQIPKLDLNLKTQAESSLMVDTDRNKVQNNESNKENQINPPTSMTTTTATMTTFTANTTKTTSNQNQIDSINTNTSSSNQDDMQRLVAYINKFEKESISNAANVVGCTNSIIEITNSNTPPQIDRHSMIQTQTNKASMPSLASFLIEIEPIETNAKLRLSSSSLTSSENSSSSNHEDMMFHNQSKADNSSNEFLLGSQIKNNINETTTIKIIPNETDPVIVTTSNLNSILSSVVSNSLEMSSNQIEHPQQQQQQHSEAKIDRRMGITNKIYDHFEEQSELSERVDQSLVNDDDNYEKVILKQPKKSIESTNENILKQQESEYGEYDNDLLVSTDDITNNDSKNIFVGVNNPTSNNIIKIVKKSNLKNPNVYGGDDHIYVNVGTYEPNLSATNQLKHENEDTSMIRGSLGFDVDEIAKSKKISNEIDEIINEEQDEFLSPSSSPPLPLSPPSSSSNLIDPPIESQTNSHIVVNQLVSPVPIPAQLVVVEDAKIDHNEIKTESTNKEEKENFETNFDFELVELNNQIKKLLNSNDGSQNCNKKEQNDDSMAPFIKEETIVNEHQSDHQSSNESTEKNSELTQNLELQNEMPKLVNENNSSNMEPSNVLKSVSYRLEKLQESSKLENNELFKRRKTISNYPPTYKICSDSAKVGDDFSSNSSSSNNANSDKDKETTVGTSFGIMQASFPKKSKKSDDDQQKSEQTPPPTTTTANDQMTNQTNTKSHPPPSSSSSKSKFICKSVSNDEIKQQAALNQPKHIQMRNSFRFKSNDTNILIEDRLRNFSLINSKYESNKSNEFNTSNDDLNTKRHSSVSFDELKRRRSEHPDTMNNPTTATTNTTTTSNTTSTSIVSSPLLTKKNNNELNNKRQIQFNEKQRQQHQVEPNITMESNNAVSNSNLEETSDLTYHKNFNQKSLFKSLQDNSRIAKTPGVAELKGQLPQSQLIHLNQPTSNCLVNKSVKHDTTTNINIKTDNNCSSSESNQETDDLNKEKTTVKSKIKLMESIVNNTITNPIPIVKLKNNERSSSSSASSSSSKSPPLSPHLISTKPFFPVNVLKTETTTTTTIMLHSASNNEQIQNQQPPHPPIPGNKPPLVMARTNLNQCLSTSVPTAPLKSTNTTINQNIMNKPTSNNTNTTYPALNSSNELNKPSKEELPVECIEKNIENNFENNSKSDSDNTLNLMKNQQPICNLKEKRRTVKELMSKFEPK